VQGYGLMFGYTGIFCKGAGLWHWLTCRKFKGLAHRHFKCWKCGAKYYRAEKIDRTGKISVVDYI
jgi:hypothetical protein